MCVRSVLGQNEVFADHFSLGTAGGDGGEL